MSRFACLKLAPAAIALLCLSQSILAHAQQPASASNADDAATSSETEKRSWPRVLREQRMGLGMTPAAIAIPKPKPPAAKEQPEESDKAETKTRHKIEWQRRPDCLDHNLQIIIDELAERFGSILVTSTCRTPEHNRRVGGVKRSQHIGGHAVDFYLYGDAREAKKYLRSGRAGAAHG